MAESLDPKSLIKGFWGKGLKTKSFGVPACH